MAWCLALELGCVYYVVDSDPPCGINASFVGGECRCFAAYQGDPEVACDPIMTWRLTDACDDGADIEWRIFSQHEDWVWPSPDEVFVTAGLLVDTYESTVCYEGELLCFGGAAAGRAWDLGLNGDLACENCCFVCGAYEVDLGLLTCP